MLLLSIAIVLIGGYLLGSIPSGFLVGRARGIDIRLAGSGNIGATNVFRVLGPVPGTGVLLADALKGAIAVLALPPLCGLILNMGPERYPLLSLIAAMAAILGHSYTCWLNFRGGKGVATSAGVLAALVPSAFLITLAVFLMTLAIFRYVSLGSVLAALALPVATAFLYPNSLPLIILTSLIGLLVIWRHKANLQRLRAGTEPRIGQPKKPHTS